MSLLVAGQEVDAARASINKRLQELTVLTSAVVRFDAPEVRTWESAVSQTIEQYFRPGTTPYQRFFQFRFIRFGSSSAADQYYQEQYQSAVVRARADLIAVLNHLMEDAHSLIRDSDGSATPEKSTKRVFVVHGHDTQLRDRVEILLHRGGLEPVILANEPNRGRTLIDKFMEHASEAQAAVVLLTGDDRGCARSAIDALPLKSKAVALLRPRARQNVVFELGYFAAKLGKARVIAVCDSKVEIPSDYSGVLYLTADASLEATLVRELHALDLPIDPTRAMPK